MFSADAKRWLISAGCFVLVAALGVTAWAGVSAPGIQENGPAADLRDGDVPHGSGASGDEEERGGQQARDPVGPLVVPRGVDPYDPPGFEHRHFLPAGEGEVPSRSEAMGFDARYSSFTARGSGALDRLADQGHLSGSGTLEDPYVLERFYVDEDLVIESADRALVIREGYVAGQLKLNYVGGDLLVHHVYGEDLRVNENVRRAGPDTAGLFHDNEFGFLGQLRHFSGEFRDNKIGPRPEGVATTYLSDMGVAQLPKGLVFNFDGFLGASVHGNEILGRVDIKLHGHYHADCLTCTPHDHHDLADFPPEDQEEHARESNGTAGENKEDGPDQDQEQDQDQDRDHDHDHDQDDAHQGHDQDDGLGRDRLEALGLRSHHSIRYHSLHFHDNRIMVEDDELALRFNDRDHRGDDVTAASEPNPYLEDPHVHFTYVWLEENTLVGGRLMVDIFNAKDELHPLAHVGVVRIEGNHVTVQIASDDERHAPAHGMRLTQAQGVEMLVVENRVDFERKDDGMPLQEVRDAFREGPERIGIIATLFDRGNVSFVSNTVHDGDVGLFANGFSKSVWWSLRDNVFPEEEVRSSNTANPPNEPPPDDDGDDGRDGGGS